MTVKALIERLELFLVEHPEYADADVVVELRDNWIEMYGEIKCMEWEHADGSPRKVIELG